MNGSPLSTVRYCLFTTCFTSLQGRHPRRLVRRPLWHLASRIPRRGAVHATCMFWTPLSAGREYNSSHTPSVYNPNALQVVGLQAPFLYSMQIQLTKPHPLVIPLYCPITVPGIHQMTEQLPRWYTTF
jgi:hypothetical protein